MKIHTLTVQSTIDQQIFRDFSYFHNLTLGGRMTGFYVGSGLLAIFGAVNLFTGSPLLFFLCVACAVFIPLLYYLFYQRSLRNQIRANHLEVPRTAYTLTLDEIGVTASTEKERMTYPWANIFRVYRTNSYIYVYIIKNRAFIIPLKDVKGATPDALWDLICSHTDRTKVFKSCLLYTSRCV